MDKEHFRNLTSTGIILVLLVLSFFLLKSILLSIIMALILGYLFYPLYKKINKFIKSENISAFLICLILVLIIILPIWFLTPILIEKSFDFFVSSQQIDFITPLKNFFPNILASEQFSQEIGSTISSFVTKASNSLMNSFADLIRNFPTIILHLTVVFFTFFIALRDQEKFVDYIKSVLPFSKEVETKLFESSRAITVSVVYGRIFLGALQGIVASIGLFIFGVPHALLLSILTIIAGILPIIGTGIVWAPVAIYLFVQGNLFPAIGVIIFGLVATIIDNFLQPILLARWMKMNSALVLIGMIGGLFTFGLLGILLGPLIIAYLLIVLEIYRDKKTPGVFIEPAQHVKQLN
ncbi:MAG: AI-2E family transporter [Nanoarchaeota archaeon]|nr:AI-2E family transporter [Nanoarchaeota archaeon]